MKDQKSSFSTIWDGYCPESKLKGKQVRMRLNKWDFFESEETGLQIAIAYPGVQCVILKFRGTGDFRETPRYGDEMEKGEILSPQMRDFPPFAGKEVFNSSEEVEKYILEEVV